MSLRIAYGRQKGGFHLSVVHKCLPPVDEAVVDVPSERRRRPPMSGLHKVGTGPPCPCGLPTVEKSQVPSDSVRGWSAGTSLP